MAQPTLTLEAPTPRLGLRLEVATLLMVLLLGVVAFLVLAPLFLMLLNSFQLARPGQPAAALALPPGGRGRRPHAAPQHRADL